MDYGMEKLRRLDVDEAPLLIGGNREQAGILVYSVKCISGIGKAKPAAELSKRGGSFEWPGKLSAPEGIRQ